MFESGLFVETPAWHKLGVLLETAPTPEEAFKCSGLDWKVQKEQLFLPSQKMLVDKFAITRDLDSRILGYTGSQYEAYQNEDAFKWAAPLVESGHWKIDAAGSLRQGEVCWLLLKQNEFDFLPGDTFKEYLLFNWCHNGNIANIVQPTAIRVVCNNTLQASLSGSNKVKVRHTSTIYDKMDYIQSLFRESEKSFEEQHLAFKKLLDTTLTDKQLERLVDTIMPVPKEAGRGQTIALKNNEIVKHLVFGGAKGHQQLGIKNTAYGFFQAVSEANEHVLPAPTADHGMNILFGKGFENNKQLFKTAMSLVA
jgi:phage/plasmid-like protein (TIGR03299 family)